MSAAIVVFVVWFAVIGVVGAIAVSRAHRPAQTARSVRAVTRYFRAVDAVIPVVGRVVAALTVWLALWSVVIIVGWLLGLWAHRLQGVVDEPTFRWWSSHYVDGAWHHLWRTLTNIGSPRVTQGLTLLAALVLPIVYRGRPLWWAPSVTMIVGYAAEKYSQTILKLVVHRGHPPTTRGTWPSGGMGRLVDIYGLIIFFVILRWWPAKPRAWALGITALAFLASVQAYARINNLEHWLTDVIGGAIYGSMLLVMMVAGYAALSRAAQVRRKETSISTC